MSSCVLTRACVTALVVMLTTLPALAQPADPGSELSVALRAGGFLSLHPAAGGTPPYLSEGLGGAGLGFGAGLDLIPHSAWILGVEVQTSSISKKQTGRYIGGPGPNLTATAVHRDTLVTFLTGVHSDNGRTSASLRAGPSLVFGSTQRGESEGEQPAGRFAWTAGFDLGFRLTDTAWLAPFGRYSYALRSDDAQYYGLKPHIFRLGLEVRWSIR